MIQKLGKSERTKNTKLVVSVAVYNSAGFLLFGQRNDNKKWSLPGGHLEPEESPTVGAYRELWEETGFVPKDLSYLGGGKVPGKDIYVFAFKAQVEDEEPNTVLDPDDEFGKFRWVKEIPTEIAENLHSPKNITLQLLGLQKKNFEKSTGYWISKDGLKIPSKQNPQRLIWDEFYLEKLKTQFVKNNEKIDITTIDISKINGYNQPINKARVDLYEKMIGAGESLPPVVVRIDGDGVSLVDGNHRQEACLKTGKTLIKAIVCTDQEVLKKGAGLAVLMGGMLMGGALNPPKPIVHQIAENAGISVWTPDGLTEELHPIAHLESSWGKNLKHLAHSGGEYHTAFGALGFKPSTAHEEYKKSTLMQKVYPGLKDPADFLAHFKSNPKFYNLLASAHWQRLKTRHGSAEEAARAWRYGYVAVLNGHPAAKEDKEGYVAKYKALAEKMQKAEEPLDKMAIADLKAGAKIKGKTKLGGTFDYTHLLPDYLRYNFKLHVVHDPGKKHPGNPEKRIGSMMYAKLFTIRPTGTLKQIGIVNGIVLDHGTGLEPHSELDQEYRGQGFGRSMYEALYTHAMNNGIKHINGGPHSEAAKRVHEALARFHGLEYKPQKVSSPHFQRLPYGPYQYTIKSEDWIIEDLIKGLLPKTPEENQRNINDNNVLQDMLQEQGDVYMGDTLPDKLPLPIDHNVNLNARVAARFREHAQSVTQPLFEHVRFNDLRDPEVGASDENNLLNEKFKPDEYQGHTFNWLYLSKPLTNITEYNSYTNKYENVDFPPGHYLVAHTFNGNLVPGRTYYRWDQHQNTVQPHWGLWNLPRGMAPVVQEHLNNHLAQKMPPHPML